MQRGLRSPNVRIQDFVSTVGGTATFRILRQQTALPHERSRQKAALFLVHLLGRDHLLATVRGGGARRRQHRRISSRFQVRPYDAFGSIVSVFVVD